MALSAVGGIAFGAAYIGLKLLQIAAVGRDADLVASTQRLQASALAPVPCCPSRGAPGRLLAQSKTTVRWRASRRCGEMFSVGRHESAFAAGSSNFRIPCCR